MEDVGIFAVIIGAILLLFCGSAFVMESDNLKAKIAVTFILTVTGAFLLGLFCASEFLK